MKTPHVLIRATDDQQVAWTEAAARDGASNRSEWIRERLDEAAAGRMTATRELRALITALEVDLVDERQRTRRLARQLLAFRRSIDPVELEPLAK